MSMSLTLSQPAKTDFGGRTIHDFSPRIQFAKSRVSPKPARVDSPVSSLRASASTDNKMATSHRGLHGLPPPSAMTLPDPGRPPPSFNQHLGQIPTPPSQWQGQEDSMRNWLAAKAEEDKRKQEEERTKQESLKLDQRRIEQNILRESLSAGVPPTMIPLIYAGIGGSNLGNISLDWLQQYGAHLQATTQQVQQQSPEGRRETRLIGQGLQSYGLPQHSQQVVPSQHSEQAQQSGSLQTTFSAYQPAPSRPAPTSAPRSATHTQLPRLTTNELYVHQPSQQGTGSAHPLQQSHTVQQDQPASSPSIYFHHWVPPSESKSNMPQTPASKGEPLSAHPGSHLSESDYKESPRKRKAQGPHQPAPPPSAGGPQGSSPPFSTASSTSGRKPHHVRSRSNTSGRESGDSRPDSRRDPDPARTSQPDSGQLSEGARPRAPSSSLQHEESTGQSSIEDPQESRGDRPASRESR